MVTRDLKVRGLLNFEIQKVVCFVDNHEFVAQVELRLLALLQLQHVEPLVVDQQRRLLQVLLIWLQTVLAFSQFNSLLQGADGFVELV